MIPPRLGPEGTSGCYTFKLKDADVTCRKPAYEIRHRMSNSIRFELVRHGSARCPVGPSAGHNLKIVARFFRIVRCYYRRTGEVRSSAPSGIPGNVKHDMRVPAHVIVAQILSLRHHVDHRSRSQRGEFLIFKMQT
jgi:hypothetical protein